LGAIPKTILNKAKSYVNSTEVPTAEKPKCWKVLTRQQNKSPKISLIAVKSIKINAL
jgi:hypothetical protein